jgi:hypothetical protein
MAAKNKSVRHVGQRGQNLASGVGCDIGIKARFTGCLVVPTGLSGSLKGVDCNISHRRVKTLYEHAHLD